MDTLESAASTEFRWPTWPTWRNLAGLDYIAIDPDAPFPTGLLASTPKLMTDWHEAGACDGFTLMPNILPGPAGSVRRPCGAHPAKA